MGEYMFKDILKNCCSCQNIASPLVSRYSCASLDIPHFGLDGPGHQRRYLIVQATFIKFVRGGVAW